MTSHSDSLVSYFGYWPDFADGKIVELAVRNVVHGRPVKNLEALANPAALACFSDRSELAG